MVAMLSSKMMRCLSGVVVLVCFCSARPSQHERLIKTASAFALDSDSPVKLPWMPAVGGGVMFFPEINAFLVPIESLYHPLAPVVAPLPPVQPPKRRRPIVNFIKYINDKFPVQQVPPSGSYHSDIPVNTTVKHVPAEGVDDIIKTEMNANKFFGPGVSYSSQYYSPLRSYADLSPAISKLDRTLMENDRLLDRISDDLDDTTVLLMGKGGTRLTLKPVAKAVAGPRGVAVASPIAQAVLRRKDPAPEITYEPDAVAVAGPGGHAYSHPKLVITYIDEPTNSTVKPSQKTDITSQDIDDQPDVKQESSILPANLR